MSVRTGVYLLQMWYLTRVRRQLGFVATFACSRGPGGPGPRVGVKHLEAVRTGTDATTGRLEKENEHAQECITGISQKC